MKLKHVVVSIGFVLFLGIVIWLVEYPAPMPTVKPPQTPVTENRPTPFPQFQWRANTRQVYDYYAYTHTELNTTLGLNGVDKWQKNLIEMKGILNLRVFGQKNEHVYVGFQLSPVQILASQQRLPAIEKMYQQRFFMVQFTQTGQPHAFFFPAGLALKDRKTLMNTINAMQMYVPANPATTWTMQETDSAGEYEAIYTIQPGHIHKQKTHYISAAYTKHQQDTPDAPMSISVIQSNIKATLANQYAWIKELSSHEKLERYFGNNLLTKISNQLTLKISNSSIDSTLAIWQADNDPEKVIVAFKQDTTPQLSVAEVVKEHRETQLKQQFSGIKATTLVKPIVAFDAQESTMASILPAIRALESYLSVYPDASTEVGRLLQDYPMSPTNSALLIGALKNVGHSEAQSALVDILLASEPANNEQVPMQAIAITTQIEKPTPLLIDALRTMIQQERKHADTAMLALGAVSHHVDDVGEARALRQEIIDYLQTQTEADKQEVALRALANTRNDAIELADAVTPYLEAEDENVRASAYAVFSHFSDETSLDYLVTGAITDTSDYAQRKALDALSVREDADAAVIPISQQLAGEASESVRQTMIDFLGKKKGNHPQVMDVLKQQLTLETSRDMKKRIYKALYSK